MKTPKHRISIINRDAVPFNITNVGQEQNVPLGVESITLNKTKDDFSQDLNITITSKYDLNNVVSNGKNFNFINQLPTNHQTTFGKQGYDEIYGHFDYEVGDMCYVEYGYNESTEDKPEAFFGFVQNVTVINNKKVVIKVQNHAYLFKKLMYNFFKKEIEIKDLYDILVSDYNDKFDEIYKPLISEISSRGYKELADKLTASGGIDKASKVINVDMTMKDFRAENATAVDIFDKLKEDYFCKTSFFQFFGGKTYLFAGLFNLLVLQEEELPEDLKKYLTRNFAFKNFDIKYQRMGLTDAKIDEKIRKEDTTLTDSDIIKPMFVLNKSLTWQDASEIKLTINFKVLDRSTNSELEETSYGDEGGEQKTVVYYESHTSESLKKLAEEWINEYKYTGYKTNSTITSYGFPSANVFETAYIVEVYQNTTDDKAPFSLIIQKYNIQSVKITYDSKGIRQTVGLGQMLSSNIKEKETKDISFKALTTTYTEPEKATATDNGKIGFETPLPKEVKKKSAAKTPNYALLNNIDSQLETIETDMTLTTEDYNIFINTSNYFKEIVNNNGKPIGAYTKTEGNLLRFTNLKVGDSVVNTSLGTIEDAANAEQHLVAIHDLMLERTSLINDEFGETNSDILSAKRKGLDVTTRQAKYDELYKYWLTTVKGQINKTTIGFNNKINNY